MNCLCVCVCVCVYISCASFTDLEQESPQTPIHMHINSSGGNVQAGLAIHDTMQSISSPVHTLCLGHCESIAALLLSAGERGERAAMPNARIMVHQPVRTGGGASNAKQLAISAASIERSRRTLVEILAARCGRPVEEISELLEYDHVCDAQEAIALGLVDKVSAPGDLVPVNVVAPPAAAATATTPVPSSEGGCAPAGSKPAPA
jgi:ATP-dependent Clp protease protease subunit